MAGHRENPPPAAQSLVPVGTEHVLEIVPLSDAAVITLRSASSAVLLSFEVAITPAGAVVRGKAAALEIDASRVATRCDEFLVDARERIELRSRGTITQSAEGTVRVTGGDMEVDASVGGVRVRANDDVQLLGEQILLNCDRPSPTPAWAAPPAPEVELLPRRDDSGDRDLIDTIAPQATDGAAR